MPLITTDYGIVTPPPGCSLDFGHPINNGLVGCWLFNEKSGSRLTDYSGNKNHGTLTNFAMNGATSNWVGSPMGGALAFDGTDDYVLTNYTTALGENDFTWSCWINTTSTGTDRTMLVKGLYETGANTVALRMLSTGVARLYCALSPSEYWWRDTTVTINDGKWHHIVGTRHGRTNKVYIDGIQRDTSGSSGGTLTNLSSTLEFKIGFGMSGTPNFYSVYWRDYIGGVRYLNRCLTPSEVAILYSQPNIGIQSPTYYTP